MGWRSRVIVGERKTVPANYFRVPVTRIIDDVAYLCEGVAVGTPVGRRPPRGAVRALISAHGSYRRCLAAKRKWVYG